MSKRISMDLQLLSHICYYSKNIQSMIINKLSGLTILYNKRLGPTYKRKSTIGLCIASLLISPTLFAESFTGSNVAGDEIVILADDTFKPPLRDIGPTNNAAKESTTKKYAPDYAKIDTTAAGKNPRGGRLSESLDITLTDPVASAPPAEIAEAETDTNDLWQRIQNGYAMPESTSSLIAKHENWYSSRPDYVKRMVERSQRYLFHVVEEVEKRGMPTEIALLPMIESAYNPQAYSTSRASGIWQFIPSTGKHFGLKQNWWVDNRRNVTFATDAALTYLQKLHGMFGAWDLALAAYNAGEGTVSRAIERNRKLGLPTDYESLNLPPETKNYVPKLQAIKNLMTNPENYGLKIQTIANTPYFARVSAPAQIDSHLAAKLAEISDDEFLALNPSYNRPVLTSEGEKHELLLPIMSAETFRSNLANYDKPLVSWRTYIAKRGEHLDKIASKFGINTSQLRDANNLPAQKKMKQSSTLLVPNGNRTEFNKPASTNTTASATDLADGSTDESSVAMQQAANNIDISSTESAVVADSDDTNSKRVITHKVKKGDVLQSIANRYGVTVKQIMAENSLKTNRVKVGQQLHISAVNSSKSTNVANGKKGIKKQTYIVKRGDTLHSIAEKFDVAVVDIKRWNKKTGNNIQPGNRLTIMQSNDV